MASQDHLRLLTEHRLVQIVGQAEVPGRPNLYGTSREFLRVFGLGSLDDLPLVDGFERTKEVPDSSASSAPQNEEVMTKEVEASEENASVDSTPA